MTMKDPTIFNDFKKKKENNYSIDLDKKMMTVSNH